MAEYTVSNEVELGEVIWKSGPGDTIRFLAGHYGRVAVKGCSVWFPDDRSVTIGQLVGTGGAVRSATLRREGRSLFIYRKVLPFNLRVLPEEPYYHPSGASVTLVGHDKEAGGPMGVDRTAQEQLPRAIVDIEVPYMVTFDFNALRRPGTDSVEDWQSHAREQERLRTFLKGDSHVLPFGDVEYIALWALNHFIRQYAVVARSKKVKGLSFAEFRDSRTLAYGPWLPSELEAETQVFIDEYNAAPLTDAERQDLFWRCLSEKDYSVSEYIMFALEHLNYSMAAVGMAQALDEAGLKLDRDWTALDSASLPIERKWLIAEIVLCRHQIIHTRRCSLERDTRGNFEKAERLFGVEPISEYRIYATKRPWTWYYEGLLPYLELARDPTAEEIPVRSTST